MLDTSFVFEIWGFFFEADDLNSTSIFLPGEHTKRAELECDIFKFVPIAASLEASFYIRCFQTGNSKNWSSSAFRSEKKRQ